MNYFKGKSNTNKLLLISISTFALICTVIYFIYSYYAKEQIKQTLLNQLSLQTESAAQILTDSVKRNKDKTTFLYSTPPIQGLTRAIFNDGVDPLDGTTTKEWLTRLETIFSAFIVNYPDIRQIRFISKLNQGRELIRVERRENKVIVFPNELMQSKQDTDYFQALSSMHINEVYISDISLNREYGILEDPIWPTYRVAKAIFDQDYRFFGFIILNIDASSLLEELKNELAQSGFKLYLLNNDGYFIQANRSTLTFGFDLDRPEATWAKLTGNKQIPSQNKAREVLFDKQPHLMYGTQFILSSRDSRTLHIVGGFSPDKIDTLWQEQNQLVITILITLSLIVSIFTVFYQKYLNRIINLYDNQSRYEAIITGSSDAIISIDVNGKVLNWNEAATYIFGLNKELAIAKNINQIIGITHKDNFLNQQLLSNTIKNKQPFTYEVTAKADNQEPMFLSVNLSPIIPHTADTPDSIALLIRDITELKNNEQKIVDHNESLEQQVRQRTHELELATDKAIEANHSKSTFVANISHEIRTPLNGISGMLELIKNDPLTTKQSNYVNLAKVSISSLSVLINDLLNLSKIEAGKIDIELKEFNIVKAISSVIESMSIKSMEKDIELLFDWNNIEHQWVLSDDYRFKQVLVNLIGNAIKFTDKGTIEVHANTSIDESNPQIVNLTISVEDTGVGMTEEQQDMLFQPFTQATKNTDKLYGGTGLGLSISKKLVTLLGGDIKVTSNPDKGSTFTFTIQSKLIPNDNDLLRSPVLRGKKVIFITEHKKAYQAISTQLTRWHADVNLVNQAESQSYLDDAIVTDLIIVEADAYNNALNQWVQYCTENQQCQLILIENSKVEYINSQAHEQNISIAPPLLPYTFLSIIESIFGNKTADSTDSTPLKEKQEQQQFSILVVDDNEINQIVAVGLLEELPLKIQTAYNGQEALDVLNTTKDKFDLILMDCQMPVMNGFKATELIRQEKAGEHNRDIIIIAMTAGAMVNDKDACLKSGMNDFIAKPLDANDFRHKVFSWLDKSKTAHTNNSNG